VVVQALKGVIKDTLVHQRLYPVWNIQRGTHSGIIVIAAMQIVNVCGMIKQYDQPLLRHLVPPREKIWNHALLTDDNLRALTTILTSSNSA
jgi:hypothetical protein